MRKEESGMTKESYEDYSYLTVRELFNKTGLVDLV